MSPQPIDHSGGAAEGLDHESFRISQESQADLDGFSFHNPLASRTIRWAVSLRSPCSRRPAPSPPPCPAGFDDEKERQGGLQGLPRGQIQGVATLEQAAPTEQ